MAAAPSLPPTVTPRLELVRPVDLRCAGCSYGVVVRAAPERCPMCGGSTWQHVPYR